MRSRAALTTTPRAAARRPAGVTLALAAVLVAHAATSAAAEPVARTTRASHARPVVRAKPIAIAAPAGSAAPAPHAAGLPELVARRWPSLPQGHHLTLSEQITDRLTEMGNLLGDHLDLLSQEMFQLRVDGRNRRAHVRFGGGGDDSDLFTFQIDGDIQFYNLNARVDAYIDLGFRSHRLRLALPAFHVQATEYQGDYGVQLEIPVFEQRF
jgi:hypothetical protein